MESKNYTEITALEWTVASYWGLKNILHWAQTFAIDLYVTPGAKNNY